MAYELGGEIPGRLGMAQIAKLLGVSRPRAWQLRRQPGFPEPAGRDGGRDYWWREKILRWAAANRGLAERAPLLYRPADDRPARFAGGRVESGQPMLIWDTPLGRLAIVYPVEGQRHVSLRVLIERAGLDIIVQLRPGWSPIGPDLQAVDAARAKEPYEPEWSDLARALHGPAPWWPDGLRHPDEITTWRPGDCREVEPQSPVDLRPLQEISDRAPAGSSIAAAARAMAADVRESAALGPEQALDYLDGLDARDRAHIHLAARPLRPAATGEPAIPESLRRDGWAQILRRTDNLARQCVHIAMQWDGGRYFPYGGAAEITPTPGTVAAEWAGALQPSEELAGHAIVDGDRTAVEYLLDPRTDMPAARERTGAIRSSIPQRLPALAPLAEVILYQHQVFIRTDDRALYLAPETLGYGLAWGYRGSGPFQLAALIDALLNDITAATPTRATPSTGPGLLTLTQHDWPDGTVHTRDDLERARNGGH